MITTAIVQARMTSSRLPGKVLIELKGRPLLAYLIESLRASSVVSEIIIATSHGADDDPVEAFAEEWRVACFRGGLEDVAGRISAAAVAANCPHFIRVNGDSPLLDHRLIDLAMEIFAAISVDVVTNIHPRTFPRGQSVELIRTSALLNLLDKTSDPGDREHVTTYFYAHEEEYEIRNFSADQSLSHLNYCVDTKDDLTRISRIVSAMDRPHQEYRCEELVRLQESLAI